MRCYVRYGMYGIKSVLRYKVLILDTEQPDVLIQVGK
jgi:hypothetical protein